MVFANSCRLLALVGLLSRLRRDEKLESSLVNRDIAVRAGSTAGFVEHVRDSLDFATVVWDHRHEIEAFM